MVSSMSTQKDPRARLSRRGFLKAAGATAGSAAIAGSAGVIPFSQSRAAAQGSWDFEHDVVVAGTGGAAFAAAVTANELGNSVIMLEKGTYIGGTTYVSGGGHWTPLSKYQEEAGIQDDRELALKYMARLSFPQFYNPEAEQLGIPDREYSLLVAYIDNAWPAVEFLENAGAMASTLQLTWDQQRAQVDYFDHFEENQEMRGRLIQPLTPDGTAAGGAEMIRQYTAYADEKGIEILLSHRVDRLVVNEAGEVIGVEVTVLPGDGEAAATPEGEASAVVTFRARKGVFFGTGGFAKNYEMMRQFMPGPIQGGCGAVTNEGEFVRIATALGAKLGGMTTAWLQQSIFEQTLDNLEASNCIPFVSGDSMFMVNRTGKRIVNEKRSYNDRPRVQFIYNPNTGDWENRLMFIVFDERSRQNWAGFAPYPPANAEAPHLITGETLDELSANIDARLAELAPHTGGFALTEDFGANLSETFERFNGFAVSGTDEDFQRGEFLYDQEWPFPPTNPEAGEWPSADQPNKTMYPLSETGPYYAIILSVGTFDTNGGPMTNDKGQVIDWWGNAIPGLYGAGNCVASVSQGAYWGGGQTLGTATTFGWLAGKSLNDEPIKEA